MRWEKLGKIFDPGLHDLGPEIVGFAQGPQALVCGDRVRVYFSTRLRSANGKFISTMRYADFDRGLQRLLGVASHEVIPSGELGTFDEHGIFPMNVLRVGPEIFAYTCGWSRRVSVSIDMAIGLAISRDGGQTFVRKGPGPVLAAGLNEPNLVGDPFVMRHGDQFRMWYIHGVGWQRRGGEPERVYKIAECVSDNGVDWKRSNHAGMIADRLGPDECQAMPTVVQVGTRHHMFFCCREAFDFRTHPGRGYRIGHAWSDDLVHWTRADDEPGIEMTPGAWDSDMMCYPNVFECDGAVYLLYNGNEFGRHGFGAARLTV
jgi:hypothetical protein